MNRSNYSDNIDFLRDHIDHDSVDLVHLDPPFNSNASYDVLFKEHDGTQAAAQPSRGLTGRAQLAEGSAE